MYISHRNISKKKINTQNQYSLDLIINNQINEAINFVDNNIASSLVQSLMENQCQLKFYSRSEPLKSKYASFYIEGEPVLANIDDPYADSGCLVRITYGQGSVNNYSNEIKDKVLYLSFTNGGNFIIVPKKTTLERKQWPVNKIPKN
ncbi:MAG: hypothetical protein GKC53_03045 [Neisseriaceae bacterium]|nr:MAG: hypothetical protein GKC53_03045 [Neisseriaceae bacterium]